MLDFSQVMIWGNVEEFQSRGCYEFYKDDPATEN